MIFPPCLLFPRRPDAVRCQRSVLLAVVWVSVFTSSSCVVCCFALRLRMYADEDFRNASQTVLSGLHTPRMSPLAKCRLEPLEQFRCIQHNKKLKKNQTKFGGRMKLATILFGRSQAVQLAFLHTCSINTAELGYIVVKATEYFVSL